MKKSKSKSRYEESIQIPGQLISRLNEMQENPQCPKLIQHLGQCLRENDSVKQIAFLKKIGLELQAVKAVFKDKDEQFLFCLNVLAEIFVACNAKNPARRTVASIFDGLSAEHKRYAYEILTKACLGRLQELHFEPGKQKSEGTLPELRSSLDMISSLMENFTLGEETIRKNGFTVLLFLEKYFEKKLQEARRTSSPALQTCVMMDCLVNIKTVIAVLQKSSELVKSYLRGENYDRLEANQRSPLVESIDTNNTKTNRIQALIIRLTKNMAGLLSNDSFLPDCRSAAGMALPLMCKLSCPAGKNVVTVVLEALFDHRLSPNRTGERTCEWFMDNFKVEYDPLSFSHLCLCHGMLTMLSKEDLIQPSEIINGHDPNCGSGTLLFDVLFVDICGMCETLKDSSFSLSAFRLLSLWSSETRNIVTSPSCPVWIKSKVLGIEPVAKKLLSYVWCYWDHPVEGVRHQTRAIFDSVINMHVAVTSVGPCDPFLKDVTMALIQVDWHVRGKYGPLCCIVPLVGAETILRWHPTIPQDVLSVMTDHMVASHVVDFIEQMSSYHKKEIEATGSSMEKWFQTWVLTLLERLQPVTDEGAGGIKGVVEICIPRLLKCCPESLQFITSHLQEKSQGSGSAHLGTLITCLKTARSQGFIKATPDSSQELWRGVVSMKMLIKALSHIDEQVRAEALGLLCECKQTTEYVTEQDLQLMKHFWPLNMTSQSPSFRQKTVGLMKKFLTRVKECIRILVKKLKKEQKASHISDEYKDLYLYKEFLSWFSELQFESLFPGASFPRRTTALNNLILLERVFGSENCKDSSDMEFRFSDAITDGNICVLLDCLSDTYDLNKNMAYELLCKCHPSSLPFQDSKSLREWKNTCESLISSPRAVDSSTAAVLLRLLIDKCPSQLMITYNLSSLAVRGEECDTPHTEQGSPVPAAKNTSETNGRGVRKLASFSNTPNESKLKGMDLKEIGQNPVSEVSSLLAEVDLNGIPCNRAFSVLRSLVLVLMAHSEVAKESLTQASLFAPMHGVLFCIRQLLSHITSSDVAGNLSWQKLVTSLLDVSFRVADLVSPVVTSSSPEGQTAEESDDIQTIFEGLEEEEDTAHVFAPTAQLLLVCCWRTMKEVALLLGELSYSNAPTAAAIELQENSLLSSDQVRKIGDFYTTILLTSKHRGAFELAYTGFSKLCSMLWRCHDATLQCLPQHWLNSLLKDISSSVPSEVLSGTRRSAGVPFFVQAIVTTEPSSGRTGTFKGVMEQLIRMAKDPLQELKDQDFTLPQVHARNILRALYRDTRLGELVFPFVADGVAVAVCGFASDSWAVRNSSTMLFSALVTRIFGIKKEKDEHSKRNRMTGREFFSRFPALHPFLLQQLEVATDGMSRRNTTYLHPSLYPVLLLLSKLYPSAMDGVDSALNMAPFIPHVIRCGASSILKTRTMASQAIVPLVSAELLVSTVKQLVKALPERNGSFVHENQLHGTLLQIQALLHGHLVDSGVLPDSIKHQLINYVFPHLESRAWIVFSSTCCPLTVAVFLEIVADFVVDVSWLGTPVQSCEFPREACELLQPLRTLVADLAYRESYHDTCAEEAAYGGLIGSVFVRRLLAKIGLRVLGISLGLGKDDARAQIMEFDTDTKMEEFIRFVHLLIQAPDYEIRLVVLEYLYNFTRACMTGNEKESSSVQEEHCLRTLFAKEDRVILKELLRMVVDTEADQDCLTKVFQLLCMIPSAIIFPWKCLNGKQVSISECWKLVLSIVTKPGQQWSLKAAALEFLRLLMSEVYQLLLQELDYVTLSFANKATEEFASVLTDCSVASEDEDMRYSTAQLLSKKNAKKLLFDTEKALGAYPLCYWKVVMNLLLDDDMEVRDCMARGITTAFQDSSNQLEQLGSLSCTDTPVQPTRAIKLVVSVVLKTYLSRTPVACLEWLMGWICGGNITGHPSSRVTSCSSGYEERNRLNKEETNMDRLFEKGALNTYAEEAIVSSLVLEVLENEIKMNEELKCYDKGNVSHDKEILFLMDKITSNCINNLEILTKKGVGNRKVLFLSLYQSISGLVAAAQLNKAYSCEKSVNNYLEVAERERPAAENLVGDGSKRMSVKSRLMSVVRQFHTCSVWTRFVSHALLKNRLSEMCELFELKFD